MFRFTAKTLRAAAIVIPALLATSIAVPSQAQSFDDFHSRLAPYGTWSNNSRWGEVWHPTQVARDFRPYYNGHWEDTNEYGWLWVADESWGDVPYHYGRWVSDPREGWLWVPGYVWGPSWVVWRSGGGNIGWFPMPPADDYYGDGAYRGNYNDEYGYRDWYGPSFGNEQFLSLWVFVSETHFRDRDFRNYAVPQRDYGRFISQTRDSTNYVTINNYVVNRSVDGDRLRRDTKQNFQPRPASQVIGRNALVNQAATGRQVEVRERQRHPIPVNINPAEQRGRANASAPPLNQAPGPQGAGGRGRGSEPSVAVQPIPQTGRGAAPNPPSETPRQNGRGQANINPAQQRGRVDPIAKEQQPAKVNPEKATPEKASPEKVNPPAQAVERRGNDRAQAPQVRAAPEQNSKAVAQDSRTPPRARGDVPAPAPAVERQGGAKANQARGNKPNDAKDNEDRKAPDEKKGGAGRGQN